MPKKTKKQKIRAQTHREVRPLAWPASPRSEPTDGFEPVTFNFVNREFTDRKSSEPSQPQLTKKAVNSDQNAVLASVKKDLLKTFLLASVILGSEAVLYFFWK